MLVREPGVIAEPTDAAEPIDLEQALDELFATPPEAFVAARNALAKALRGEKRRVEAGAVAAYRRPGRTAGALNRLVLSGDPAFEVLLDAVDAVRSADAETYRDAVASLRAATTAAVDAVLAASPDERSEDRGDLTMALQAIVGDDNALTVLGRGRLEDVPAAGLGGFGGFGGFVGGDAAPAARGPVERRKPRLPGARGVAAPVSPADDDGEPDAEIDDTLARRRAEKALRAATEAAEKAERALAAAEVEAESAGVALAGAEEQVTDAEAALERAQADQRAAADTAGAAQERLDAAREKAAEAADAHRAAAADLDALAD